MQTNKFIDKWFFPAIRAIGASFFGGASLVQLQSEKDSQKMRADIEQHEELLGVLSDPISSLHEDVRKVSKAIFDKIVELNSSIISFDANFYKEHRRVLGILEQNGLIEGQHSLFAAFYAEGLTINDPTYLLYLGSLCAPAESMKKLYDLLDSCSSGQIISTQKAHEETGLPSPIVEAMFKTFEFKGYGNFMTAIPSSYNKYRGL